MGEGRSQRPQRRGPRRDQRRQQVGQPKIVIKIKDTEKQTPFSKSISAEVQKKLSQSKSILANANRPGLSIDESGPICLPQTCLLLLRCSLLYSLFCGFLCR